MFVYLETLIDCFEQAMLQINRYVLCPNANPNSVWIIGLDCSWLEDEFVLQRACAVNVLDVFWM